MKYYTTVIKNIEKRLIYFLFIAKNMRSENRATNYVIYNTYTGCPF